MSTAAATLHVDDEWPSIDLLVDLLVARAETRAYLYAEWEIPCIHDAVDPLWAWAERWGLVAYLGADTVQGFLSEAFARVRDDL